MIREQDGAVVRIIEVEERHDEIVVFDTTEEDEQPGGCTVTHYSPETGLAVMAEVCEVASRIIARRKPAPLPLFERNAA